MAQPDPYNFGKLQKQLQGVNTLQTPLAPQVSTAKPRATFPTVAPANVGGRDVGYPYGVQPEGGGGIVGRYKTMQDYYNAAQQQGAGMWRGQRALPGQGGVGGAQPDLSQYQDIQALTPEQMSQLTPAAAAVLQAQDAQRAAQAEAERAEQALERVSTAPTTGPAAAPDIENILSPPGFDEAHWARLRRQKEGEINARFAQMADAIRRQGGTGGKVWMNQELARLGRQRDQAIRQEQSRLATRRDEVTQQMEQQYINAMLQRYNRAAPEQRMRDFAAAQIMQRPEYYEPWTQMEEYVRGARRQAQADAMQRAMGSVVVIPKSGGGGDSGPGINDNWGQQPAEALPHEFVPAQGRGAQARSPYVPSSQDIGMINYRKLYGTKMPTY